MYGKLRNMTALYLINGEQVLLLYRIGSKIADKSYVGCAGGHFEEEELNDAQACVLRELREETGLTASDIKDLAMRYITMRLKNGEVRQNYYFFAQLCDPTRTVTSNEGILSWVPLTDIDNLPMPQSAKSVLRHYRAYGRYDCALRGGVTEEDGVDFHILREF